ncbi:nitroreductase [Salinarimonas soli]|uniref:nitroreductase n=1 Tax=Salinarimonas soli TaxID=1638099 RepID=UPI001F0A684E|nr:nitroreductase [Salinarimonas soli]
MPHPPEAVEAAILSRRSVRAFRPDPVPPALVRRLLAVASRAPSGTNMQPWRVYVVTGAARDRLCDALVAAHANPSAGHESEYPYYPDQFFEPYLSRRRKVGLDLYGLLGIARGERERMHAQHARNFRFFDAPVGLVTTIDRRLAVGSWLDHGMFLQSLMIAARAHGLDTCPQAAFAPYHGVIRAHLPLRPEEVVVCGMAVGYADEGASENALATERMAVDEFAAFLGDEPGDGMPFVEPS